jgi:UTP--glucose-1-phosphate uridylyltransferase
MPILADLIHAGNFARVQLSSALAILSRRERYLALAVQGTRFNIGMQYGLLMAQLALALSGPDRDLILTELVELLARGSVSPAGNA